MEKKGEKEIQKLYLRWPMSINTRVKSRYHLTNIELILKAHLTVLV